MKGSKLFLLFAILVLALSACTAAPTTAPTQPPAAEATQPPAAEATEPPAIEATEPPAEEPVSVSGTINLYTSEPEDQVNMLVNDFNTLYPDVTVNVFRSGSGEVIAKIQAEQQAGQILADVIWFADMDFFKSLADQDLMMAYEPKGSEAIDEIYHYNGDRYHEVRQIFNVVAYNTTLVTEPPTSWKDLLKEEYAGRVGMPSALYSGAAFNQVGTFANMPEFGWEFFEQLNANGVVVEQGNGAVATKLSSGEFVIAQLVDSHARGQALAGSPVAHIWPEEGALLVPTPIGILNSTQNPPAAQAFLDYLYTDQAQALFAEMGYISVFPDAATPEGTPDMSNLKVILPDAEFINANRDEIRSRFEQIYGAPAQ